MEEQNKGYLEITIDFHRWADAWLKDILGRENPELNVSEVAGILRASFEKRIPDDFVTVNRVEDGERPEHP